MYFEEAFLEDGTLIVRSSGSVFCRNSQNSKGKTMQKLTRTLVCTLAVQYIIHISHRLSFRSCQLCSLVVKRAAVCIIILPRLIKQFLHHDKNGVSYLHS